MYTALKNIFADIAGKGMLFVWTDDRDIRNYFKSEFKRNSNHAYEYWLSTGQLNYQAEQLR